jgi:hypothetical protein
MRNVVISGLAVAGLTFATLVPALAQGTKDQTSSSTQTSSATRSGAATNGSSDSMGGAFRGTGTPTYGTSPGMGSTKNQRH